MADFIFRIWWWTLGFTKTRNVQTSWVTVDIARWTRSSLYGHGKLQSPWVFA
jgi:hypothetical protein